jgi:hypothetical protein
LNGLSAAVNGRSFFNGNLPRPSNTSVPIIIEGPLSPEAKLQRPKYDIPQGNQDVSFTVNFSDDLNANIAFPVERNVLRLAPARPSITGYHPRLSDQIDLYHNFPSLLDEIIIQNGSFTPTSSGGYWYSASGTISKIVAGEYVNFPGYYTIGVLPNGVVYHRCFYNVLPTVY